MAYMRGEWYVYRGGGMEIYGPGGEASIPQEIFDMIALMRVAQLTDEDRERLEARAVEEHGMNFGCAALCKKRGVKDAYTRFTELLAPGPFTDQEPS